MVSHAKHLEKIRHWKLIIIVLLTLLGLTAILSTALGSVKIPPKTVYTTIINNILEHNSSPTKTELIILKIRLPRVLLALTVGAALAVAGVVMQGLFKNPMADPYIIGISSGAALGASTSIVLGLTFLGSYTLSFTAFVGAVLAVFLVYNIARVGGSVPVGTLLLSGIALTSFMSAITALLTYLAGEKIHQIIFWLMGGLWNASWIQVKIALPLTLAGTLVIYTFSKDLNVMLLGEESAKHIGIDTNSLRKILLITTSLITGVAVSVSGIIGFVGLIIPHVVRILTGPDHRILIPASALTGAIFLICTDTLARTVIAPTEVPVGIITALFGAPFFIYLLRKKKKMIY